MIWRRRDNRPRRVSRPVGCLIWVIGLIVLLIVLATLFGGFQKGTKASGPAIAAPVAFWHAP
jgi:hypothetical protein